MLNTKLNQIVRALTTRLPSRPQFQIFRTIICSNAIFMMDGFKTFKLSANNIFHHYSMFLFSFSIYTNVNISKLIDTFTFFISTIAPSIDREKIMLSATKESLMLFHLGAFAIDCFFASFNKTFMYFSTSKQTPNTNLTAIHSFFCIGWSKKEFFANRTSSGKYCCIVAVFFQDLFKFHFLSPFKKIRAAVVNECQKHSRRPLEIEMPLATF